ncbi:MAG: GTP-binding protein [Rhodospirillales bacterium]|nr:GTP-binding protein [Rhodospirillales bacterium]
MSQRALAPVPVPVPVPVIVIGGFLGAGKTTVLNHILSQQGDLRAAVLVNDFGAINIDADLVVGVKGDVYRLSNGCVCCNIRGDLIDGCLDILRELKRPDLLIVETSGVSDALQVANTFLAPELQGLLSVHAILGVVDAAHFVDLEGDMAALAQGQLAGADIVVLNKVDLVGADALVELRTRIRRAVPGSRILEAIHGRIALDVILDQADRAGGRRSTLRAIGQDRHPHPSMTAWHWECARPLSLDRLRDVFSRLPEDVYRAKGIAYLDDLPNYRVLLQMVGKRSSLAAVGIWADETPATRIVLIGTPDAFDSEEMQSEFEACVADTDTASSPLKTFVARVAAREPENDTQRY